MLNNVSTQQAVTTALKVNLKHWNCSITVSNNERVQKWHFVSPVKQTSCAQGAITEESYWCPITTTQHTSQTSSSSENKSSNKKQLVSNIESATTFSIHYSHQYDLIWAADIIIIWVKNEKKIALLTFIRRSLPTVSKSFLFSSKCIAVTACRTLWKVANDACLQKISTVVTSSPSAVLAHFINQCPISVV